MINVPANPNQFYNEWIDWKDFLGFIKPIDEAKQLLLNMAKRDEPKPKKDTQLGRKLRGYTYKRDITMLSLTNK